MLTRWWCGGGTGTLRSGRLLTSFPRNMHGTRALTRPTPSLTPSPPASLPLSLSAAPRGSPASGARGYKSPSGFDFDTHRLVVDLTKTGMPQEQAEALTKALQEIIGASNAQLKDQVVSIGKDEERNLRHAVKADVDAVRKDLATLRLELETQLTRAKDELKRVEAGHRLDLSLEKGRVQSELDKLRTANSQTETSQNEALARLQGEVYAIRETTSTRIATQRWLVGLALAAGGLLTSWCVWFVRLRFIPIESK
eukprot:TRINITY_DN7773_c0_g1_i1.p1 TRINITY_DN7773_c0_g1~~TRINITY_DN7773_c0_g1_i1.p1  ORF type:complete len:254 (-),score=47.56 TRINITY_DN7773_c0_g1_i1:86-847(-)